MNYLGISFLVSALLVVFGGGSSFVHHDRAWDTGQTTTRHLSECRVHMPKAGDVVILYWDADNTPGLSKGDVIYSKSNEPCIDAVKGER